jgi:sulfur relay (sulfurtransferase) DsrC/TusE family protein
MNQHSLSFSDKEISGSNFTNRLSDLDAQCWSRAKSQELAKLEGLELEDDHWAVISFLRSHYLWNGDQLNDAQISDALNLRFSKRGGEQYLTLLFNGDAVTQGRRLANIHPAHKPS